MRNHFKEVAFIMLLAFSLAIATASIIMLIYKHLML